VKQDGLVYSKDLIGNLVTKDTDLDGIPDWEESLWGTDPRKSDTDEDGIPDGEEIAALKKEKAGSEGLDLSLEGEERLTETDKFSREFLATVATLNQNGSIDQETVEKLGEALSDRIKNSEPRKIFTTADIEVIEDDSVKAVKIYDDNLNNIFKKYSINYSVIDILGEFMADGDDVNIDALSKLDPVIEQAENIVDEMLRTKTPQSLAPLHLDFINKLEIISENLNDIQLFDTDVIIALSAISQYETSVVNAESAIKILADTVEQKLSN
jgi:hypothetical protein